MAGLFAQLGRRANGVSQRPTADSIPACCRDDCGGFRRNDRDEDGPIDVTLMSIEANGGSESEPPSGGGPSASRADSPSFFVRSSLAIEAARISVIVF